MTAVIDTVRVVPNASMPAGDVCFVAVEGAGETGWYGPVSAEIGEHVRGAIAEVASGQCVVDHRRLHSALREVVGEEPTAAMSWAVGAVDCATWDLHGHLAHASVADLLAPAHRHVVPLYASWLGLDLADGSRPTVVGVGQQEWTFTKWGLRRGSGVSREAEAARLVATAQAVRAALGRAAAFDAVFTWDADLAHLVANQLGPAAMLWLEDPLPCHDLDAYRLLARAQPVAFGERLLVHQDALALLDLRPKALTIDVVACGGLTRSIDVVEAARAHGIPVYPHGRSFAPALHLAAAYPDAVPAVEYRLQWEPDRQRLYARPLRPAHGAVALPETPGLGTTPRSR